METETVTRPPGALLAMALGQAEDALDRLPYTEEVRSLRTRHLAMRTVFTGMIQGGPRLTDAQRSRFVVDTLALASDVHRARERWGV
ncbi:MAG TPA: hypothetical protein VGI39_09115 [Polyangiaceae bacterium]